MTSPVPVAREHSPQKESTLQHRVAVKVLEIFHQHFLSLYEPLSCLLRALHLSLNAPPTMVSAPRIFPSATCVALVFAPPDLMCSCWSCGVCLSIAPMLFPRRAAKTQWRPPTPPGLPLGIQRRPNTSCRSQGLFITTAPAHLSRVLLSLAS